MGGLCQQQVRASQLGGAGGGGGGHWGPDRARSAGRGPRTGGGTRASQIAEEGALASEPLSRSPYLGSAPRQGWGLG